MSHLGTEYILISENTIQNNGDECDIIVKESELCAIVNNVLVMIKTTCFRFKGTRFCNQ